MSNDVVRYSNGLNAVPLRNFTSVDMDLFWGICSKMKRKGTHEELLSFDQVRELIIYDSSKGIDRFYNDLIKMSNKLSTMYFVYQTESIYDRLNLFQRFKIDKNNQTILVKVSDEFEWILNNIGKNFTRFELETMTKLSSTYTKELYRQLMAHKELESGSGAWYVKVEEFRKILSIPASYRMSDIDRQVLNTAKKEFTLIQENGRPLFEYFRVEKVKAKKGNRISSFKIYFKEHRLNISMHNWLNEDE
ncbi:MULTISPECIES: replication initiation protein [Enterococcus]|uniref:replication initiation protein n=1 Tax=Enterococcus TaxID=1350 RepID=UPI002073B2BA|nr:MULTISPECIES: replication initiation protein [Enterococcus]MDY5174874.1 replication initiation protein [Enterococcus faecium]